MSKLTEFMCSSGVDHTGRTYEDLLQLTDEQLEDAHDVIQYLFPLTEASAHWAEAPILTADDILKARISDVWQNRLEMGFHRMLSFYGFRMSDAGVVLKSPEFSERSNVWLKPNNHNFKRLTRMLHCLHLFGQTETANALFFALKNLTENAMGECPISDETLSYWEKANTPETAYVRDRMDFNFGRMTPAPKPTKHDEAILKILDMEPFERLQIANKLLIVTLAEIGAGIYSAVGDGEDNKVKDCVMVSTTPSSTRELIEIWEPLRKKWDAEGDGNKIDAAVAANELLEVVKKLAQSATRAV